MTRTPSDQELADRIRGACAEQSRSIAVADRPFAVDGPPDAGMPAAVGTGGGRRRVLGVAAAVVAVGILVVGIAVTRPDDRTDTLRAASTTSVPSTPSTSAPTTVPAPGAADTWLAPSSPPLGLDLVSSSWRAKPDPTATRSQLFTAADGGRVLIEISPGELSTAGDHGMVVRGQPSILTPWKTGTGTAISWSEGAAIEARFAGMDEPSAVALIDRLVWRSDDHVDGFDVPPGGAIALEREAEPGQVSHDAELSWADAPSSTGVGVGQQVELHTKVADAPTADQVEFEFLAGQAGLGADGSSSSYDPEFGTLMISWPGRSAWIDANKTDVSEAELRAIAETLVPVTEGQLQALQRGEPGGELASDPPTTTAPEGTTTSTVQDLGAAASTEPLDVPLEQLDGSAPTSISELAAGRPVVAVLWTTWCVPCIRAVQALDQVAQDHPEALVVAVADQDAVEDVQAFVEQSGIGVPVLLDPDGELRRGWGSAGLPYGVVVGADGQVRGSASGPLDGEAELRAFADHHLAG